MGLALPLITQLLLVSSTWKSLRHRARGRMEWLASRVLCSGRQAHPQEGMPPVGESLPRRGPPQRRPKEKVRAYRCQGCLSPRGAMCSRLLKRKKVAAELPPLRQLMGGVGWVLGWPLSLATLVLNISLLARLKKATLAKDRFGR